MQQEHGADQYEAAQRAIAEKSQAEADPRGGSDGRAHWRNQDLYGPGIPECG